MGCWKGPGFNIVRADLPEMTDPYRRKRSPISRQSLSNPPLWNCTKFVNILPKDPLELAHFPHFPPQLKFKSGAKRKWLGLKIWWTHGLGEEENKRQFGRWHFIWEQFVCEKLGGLVGQDPGACPSQMKPSGELTSARSTDYRPGAGRPPTGPTRPLFSMSQH